MPFWLYTTRTPRITLHADGCGLLRLVTIRHGRIGPLSWDQLALLPVTYHICQACRPGSPSRCRELPAPKPKRVSSREMYLGTGARNALDARLRKAADQKRRNSLHTQPIDIIRPRYPATRK